jgi:hypothetical protein
MGVGSRPPAGREDRCEHAALFDQLEAIKCRGSTTARGTSRRATWSLRAGTRRCCSRRWSTAARGSRGSGARQPFRASTPGAAVGARVRQPRVAPGMAERCGRACGHTELLEWAGARGEFNSGLLLDSLSLGNEHPVEHPLKLKDPAYLTYGSRHYNASYPSSYTTNAGGKSWCLRIASHSHSLSLLLVVYTHWLQTTTYESECGHRKAYCLDKVRATTYTLSEN